MPDALPKDGYLQLPLRLQRGALVTCSVEESIRRFLQLNLNVPVQGREKPVWMPADPDVGCRIPHYEYQSVAKALASDVGRLIAAIDETVRTVEDRVRHTEVEVVAVAPSDSAREKPDGSRVRESMQRVVIRCQRVDGEELAFAYDIAFGGSGPVFVEIAE